VKVFFDTNVVIAAFISHGVCNDLFDYCLTEHQICLSEQVLDETIKNLTTKFRYPRTQVNQITVFLKENKHILPVSSLLIKICRDPDDDKILASALQGKVDCLISGDEDLLVLQKFQGIPILKPSEFWKFETERDRK
jgi:uncharacterized protein